MATDASERHDTGPCSRGRFDLLFAVKLLPVVACRLQPHFGCAWRMDAGVVVKDTTNARSPEQEVLGFYWILWRRLLFTYLFLSCICALNTSIIHRDRVIVFLYPRLLVRKPPGMEQPFLRSSHCYRPKPGCKAPYGSSDIFLFLIAVFSSFTIDPRIARFSCSGCHDVLPCLPCSDPPIFSDGMGYIDVVGTIKSILLQWRDFQLGFHSPIVLVPVEALTLFSVNVSVFVTYENSIMAAAYGTLVPSKFGRRSETG